MNTSGIKISNAAATGLFVKNAYIYFTSYFLETSSAEEIEAVFLHELGHLQKSHVRIQAHLLFFFFLLMAFITTLPRHLPKIFLYNFVVALNVIAGYLFAHRILSKRHEKQSDEFVVDHSSSPATFIEALKKLYTINYAPKNWKSPTHPSLAKRTEYIVKRIAQRNSIPAASL